MYRNASSYLSFPALWASQYWRELPRTCPYIRPWHKNGNAQVRVDPFVQEHNCRLGMKDLQGQREAIVCFQHGEQKIIA